MSDDSREMAVVGQCALCDAAYELRRAAGYLRAANDKAMADRILAVYETVNQLGDTIGKKLEFGIGPEDDKPSPL